MHFDRESKQIRTPQSPRGRARIETDLNTSADSVRFWPHPRNLTTTAADKMGKT